MPIVEIDDIRHPAIQVYARLTDRQLRNAVGGEPGIVIVESPKVITTALNAGLRPLSLLTEKRHITGDAAGIVARLPQDVPVYTGSREVLHTLTGYKLTRGVLCAMERPADTDAASVCAGARRVAVLDGVCDTTNVGAIFRSAAALDIDAVLLTRTTCDPLNRRAVRVSMGTVFRIPWAWIDDAVADTSSLGFTTAALALSPEAMDIRDARVADIPRLALILGTEGDGLSASVIHGADYQLIIPMHRGVDSLNVAAASAIAFWQLK